LKATGEKTRTVPDPHWSRLLGRAYFAFTCCMMVLQPARVIWVVPELKGVPLDEIQKQRGIE
jgi:hypothetical protein